jgi:hypothetical protein
MRAENFDTRQAIWHVGIVAYFSMPCFEFGYGMFAVGRPKRTT